jgi:hypothetical protein
MEMAQYYITDESSESSIIGSSRTYRKRSRTDSDSDDTASDSGATIRGRDEEMQEVPSTLDSDDGNGDPENNQTASPVSNEDNKMHNEALVRI